MVRATGAATPDVAMTRDRSSAPQPGSAGSRVGAQQRRGGWLRPVSDTCLRLLIVGVTVVAALYVAARLRLVVAPLVLAPVLATLLEPLVRRLRERGVPDGAAALLVLTNALALLGSVAAAMVPRTIADFGDLDVSITRSGARKARERTPQSASGT